MNINAYPPQLLIDLAIGAFETADILESHGIPYAEYQQLQVNPTFRAQLLEVQREIAKEGEGFRVKAALLAEHHLGTVDEMMLDPLVPPATKLGIFQTLMKGGHLEPKKDAATNTNTMPTFALQINLN